MKLLLAAIAFYERILNFSLATIVESTGWALRDEVHIERVVGETHDPANLGAVAL